MTIAEELEEKKMLRPLLAEMGKDFDEEALEEALDYNPIVKADYDEEGKPFKSCIYSEDGKWMVERW